MAPVRFAEIETVVRDELGVRLSKAFADYTTSRVLTMDGVAGTKIIVTVFMEDD